MLMQNFKTDAELGLSAEQHAGLVATLAALERGELVHVPDPGHDWKVDKEQYQMHNGFHMRVWTLDGLNGCGTVCCIGGWAEQFGDVAFDIFPNEDGQEALAELFYPADENAFTATPAQAAHALRNYLTTGKANWSEAMA